MSDITKCYSYSVRWSEQDQEHVGLCAEFPSLSWLDADQEGALAGIRRLVDEVASNMLASKEPLPTPIAKRGFSGELRKKA